MCGVSERDFFVASLRYGEEEEPSFEAEVIEGVELGGGWVQDRTFISFHCLPFALLDGFVWVKVDL